MPRIRIAPSIRERVRRRAAEACEYCRIGEESQVAMFHCDHWLPHSLGGPTTLANLVWACPWCNGAKHAVISAAAAPGEVHTRIFNPRTQPWSEHFHWSGDYLMIEGRTPTGRATVRLLRMNVPKMQRIRQLLLQLGLHAAVRSGSGR